MMSESTDIKGLVSLSGLFFFFFFTQGSLCGAHIKHCLTAIITIAIITKCTARCTPLFSFLLCLFVFLSPLLIFSLCYVYLKSFYLIMSVKHLTQHIQHACFQWEHDVLESFIITLCRAVSLVGGCSTPDVPSSSAETGPPPVRTGQTQLPCRARLHFTQPQWACLKGLFLRAFQIRLLLFCEVKLKLMMDTTL